MKSGLGAAIAAMGFLATGALSASAQTARATDSRFYPFVGCWRGDSAQMSAASGVLSCVVPISGSADVELIDIADGRIANRHRLDAGGRPRDVDEQGCRGQEQASWSAQPRRLYLHSAFTCSPTGVAGSKTTLMTILPSGEWLAVESVRAGAGTITRVERRRDAGVPASLPREVAARLGRQQLAVMTARAEAATPIRPADVLEALHHTDSSVVRAWLVATGQRFQLSGDEVASLVRADVPAPVLQAMMGAAPSYQLGVGVDASGRSSDAYLSTPGIPAGAPPQLSTAPSTQNVYVYDVCCAPNGASNSAAGAAAAYQSYNYYVPQPAVTYYPTVYAPGSYATPYYYYYSYPSPYQYRRYPNSYAPSGSSRREPVTPSYYSNPVGVRPGQGATTPRGEIPSRRRP